jgi:hypothetical protein
MHPILKTGVCAVAAVLLQSAVVHPANAAYLGYGNGDPGNWDLNTEQSGGPCAVSGARSIDPATGQAKCCAQYNPMNACPLAHAPTIKTYGPRRRSH